MLWNTCLYILLLLGFVGFIGLLALFVITAIWLSVSKDVADNVMFTKEYRE